MAMRAILRMISSREARDPVVRNGPRAARATLPDVVGRRKVNCRAAQVQPARVHASPVYWHAGTASAGGAANAQVTTARAERPEQRDYFVCARARSEAGPPLPA